MKRVSLLVLSLFCAFACVEFGVRYLLRYPPLAKSETVILREYGDGTALLMDMLEPYSASWQVEGGNAVHRMNNLGLSGVDVDTAYLNNSVFLLGNSFMAALEVEQDKSAAAIFQKTLERQGDSSAVLNLASPRFDAYQCWLKSAYYERSSRPKLVMLVVESYERCVRYLTYVQKPLKFSLDGTFGRVKIWPLHDRIVMFVRQASASVNLFEVGLKIYATLVATIRNLRAEHDIISFFTIFEKVKGAAEMRKRSDDMRPVLNISGSDFNDFFSCLDQYQARYGERFVLFSLDPEESLTGVVTRYCKDHGISFFHSPSINTRSNRLSEYGHFNEQGNRILGNYLYEVFKQVCQE